MKNFNKLTPAELERLSCLAEECAEVIQCVSKVIRHGYADYSPNDPTHTDNRKNLERELGDLRYWMIRMSVEGDVSRDEIHRNADLKGAKVAQWLHHQG